MGRGTMNADFRGQSGTQFILILNFVCKPHFDLSNFDFKLKFVIKIKRFLAKLIIKTISAEIELVERSQSC